jgi:hypothetical protein
VVSHQVSQAAEGGGDAGVASSTNLLQTVNEVGSVCFEFVVGVVKPSLDYLVHNMIMAYRMVDSDQWGVASRGKRHHSHQ